MRWAGYEVHGHSVTRLLNESAEHAAHVETVLAEAGMPLGPGVPGQPRVSPDAWYPLDVMMRLLQRLGEAYGDDGLFALGHSVPVNAPFPPTARNLETAVGSIDVAFHMNHRLHGKPLFDPTTRQVAAGIGNYGKIAPPGVAYIVSPCDTPYPCAFDHGLLTCVARRFAPQARVHHLAGRCRAHGDAACDYALLW